VNAKAVITGDVTQIDLKDPASSGLVRIQGILGHLAGVSFVYFHPEDVVRHRLVRDIIRAFDEYHAQKDGKADDGVGDSLDPSLPRPPAPTLERPSAPEAPGGPEAAPSL
jgi:phosphate starvation-inducible PhoH-like protein